MFSSVRVANVCAFVICFILEVVTCVCAYTFHKLRWHPAISVRRPRLVLVQCVIQCAFLLWTPVYLLLLNDPCCRIALHSAAASSGLLSATRSLVSLCYLLMFPLVLFVLAFRAHFVWFDLGLNAAKADRAWRGVVTGRKAADDKVFTSFFLRFRHSLGNERYMAIAHAFVAATYLAVTTVSVTTNGGFPGQFACITQVSFKSLAIIRIIAVLLTLPKLDDFWRIRAELRGLLGTIPPAAIGFWVYVIIDNKHVPKPDENASAAYSWLVVCRLILASWVCFTQTIGVLYLCELPLCFWKLAEFKKTNCRRMKKNIELAIGGRVVLSQTQAQKLRVPTRTGMEMEALAVLELVKDMRYVILDGDGFRLFCRHLVREFNIENMLFLIETQQFNDYMAPPSAGFAAGGDAMLDYFSGVDELMDGIRAPAGGTQLSAQISGASVTMSSVAETRIRRATYVKGRGSHVPSMSPSSARALKEMRGTRSSVVPVPDQSASDSSEEEEENEDGNRVHLGDASGVEDDGREKMSKEMLGVVSKWSDAESMKMSPKTTTSTMSGMPKGIELKFHSDAPVSDIVSSCGELSEHEMAVLLFLKYVPNAAELTLNLSSGCKQRLENAFNYKRGRFEREVTLSHVNASEDYAISRVASVSTDSAFSVATQATCETYATTATIATEPQIVASSTLYHTGARLLLNTVSPFELAQLFDESRKEVWANLKDAFCRFETTIEYKKWARQKMQRLSAV